MTASVLVLAAVFGAIIGSFLNVVISRGPRAWGLVAPGGKPKGLAFPPSQCEQCRRHLKPWELVPIVSYMTIGGQCRTCRAEIGSRHLVVETLGAAAAVLAVAVYGITPGGLGVAVFLFFLIALGTTDAETGFLPDALTIPLLVLGVGFALIGPGPSLPFSLLGAAIGGGGLWLVAAGYRASRGREGLGGGDVKLVAAAGAWLGPAALPFVLLGASLSALLTLAAQAALGRRDQLSGETELHFGPFLSGSMAAVMLLRPLLLHP